MKQILKISSIIALVVLGIKILIWLFTYVIPALILFAAAFLSTDTGIATVAIAVFLTFSVVSLIKK